MRERHCIRDDPPACVDLHWHLIGAHIGLPIDIGELIASRQQVPVHGHPVPLPSDPWLLLITCLYCLHEPPLVEPRYFADLAALLRLVGERDLEIFRELAARSRTLRLCATALAVTAAVERTRLPGRLRSLFPLDAVAEERIAELRALLADPANWRKQRFTTYFRHFLWHGRYREHLLDRLRPVVCLPFFMLLPEDEDVLRAQRSGRPAILERALRVIEVVGMLAAERTRRRRTARSFAALESGEKPLRPRPGVTLELLDGEGLLFDPESRSLLRLSTASAWIWCGIEEGRCFPDLVRELADAFELSEEQAKAIVRDTLRESWKLGLLEGAAVPAAPEVPEEEPGPVFEGAIPEPHARLHCRILDHIIEIALPDEATFERVAPLFAAYPRPGDEDAADRLLHVVPEGAGYALVAGGRVAAAAPSLEALAPQVKAAALTLALDGAACALFLHAGMLRCGGRALLLPAAPGSGKTSLTLALARQGFAYHTDEYVLLVGEALEARGIPVPATVKSTAWAYVSRDYPVISALDAHERVDGKICKYLPPPVCVGDPALDRSWPVGWLVFPRFVEGAGTELVPLPRLQALERIFDQCLALPAALDARLVARLVSWLERLEAFELTFGDSRTAARLLHARLHSEVCPDAASRG